MADVPLTGYRVIVLWRASGLSSPYFHAACCRVALDRGEPESVLRRDFLKDPRHHRTLAALGKSGLAALPGWRQFEIIYRVTLQSQKTPVRVWIPVPQDALDYQKVLELSWRSPVATSLLWEPAARAPIVSAAWLDPAMPRETEISARIATRDRSGYCPDTSPKELAEYLARALSSGAMRQPTNSRDLASTMPFAPLSASLIS